MLESGDNSASVDAFEPIKSTNSFQRAWAKIGVGGLTLSLAIHAMLIVLAGIIVVAVKQQQENVDFLPNGGFP